MKREVQQSEMIYFRTEEVYVLVTYYVNLSSLVNGVCTSCELEKPFPNLLELILKVEENGVKY